MTLTDLLFRAAASLLPSTANDRIADALWAIFAAIIFFGLMTICRNSKK